MTEPHPIPPSQVRVDFYLQRGEMLMDSLRLEDARQQFAFALGEDPEDPIACCRMGVCLCLLGLQQEAINHGSRAAGIAPDNPLVLQNYAWILYTAQRFAEAKKVILEAIRVVPELAEAHTLLALIYIRLNDNENGKRSAQTALSLDPNSSDAHQVRAIAARKLGDTRESESHLRDAFRYDPQNPATHFAMGCAKVFRDDFDQAEIHFRESLRINPNFEPAQRMLLEIQILKSGLMRTQVVILEWFDTHLTLGLQIFTMLVIVSIVLLSRGDSKFGMLLVPFGILSFVFLFTRYVAEPLTTMWIALTYPEARSMTRWTYLGSMVVSFYLVLWLSLAVSGIALKSFELVTISIFLAYSYVAFSMTWSCRRAKLRPFMVIATILIMSLGSFILFFSTTRNLETEYNTVLAMWLVYFSVALLSLGLPGLLKKRLALQ